jgi:hypothetical protein
VQITVNKFKCCANLEAALKTFRALAKVHRTALVLSGRVDVSIICKAQEVLPALLHIQWLCVDLHQPSRSQTGPC